MPDVLHPLSHARLVDLLSRMRQVRVAVLGDVMLDRYLLGETDRISPEAPVPVIALEDDISVPGGAANAAANVAATGATPMLVGVVGDDAAAQGLVEAIAALGIATTGLITVPGRPTTTKTRIVARGQQVVRLDREVTNSLADRFRDALLVAGTAALAGAQALLIEDYDKGVLDAEIAAVMIAAATEKGIPVVVDPKARNFFAYPGATVFKPNIRELDAAFGTAFMGDDNDLESARVRLGAEHLVVTRGADGLSLVSAGGVVRETPAVPRAVFDVSGAGDTVAAWLATALAAGAGVGDSAWLANLAASITVGKKGTATVSPMEIEATWMIAAGEG
jgi:D-beta-D-heptose 7-phosphate kinase/D-beta-D-heptose 1-phosphate adenosyltransferase